MPRLLLVEDDQRVADALGEALERLGHHVWHVATGADALSADSYDLVLLDLGLPDMDGLEVCRQLRLESDVPIIAVTSRGASADRVTGLRSGADDYVVKPFSVAEVSARIEAVLRRTGLSSERHERLSFGDVVIDQAGHSVTVAGQPVRLTRKEYALLALLASKPGETFTRPEILLQVWHTAWEGKSRTVDVHVAVVRQKLDRPGLIETVRGVGYKLVVD